MRKLACALITVALALGGGAARAQSGDPPSLEDWMRVLISSETTAEELDRALVALRAMSTGLIEDPVTREANFALAEYWASLPDDEIDDDARRIMSAAVTLYPEDSRVRKVLKRLAAVQVGTGDSFGAYVTFGKLLDSDLAEERPDLAVHAALAAAEFGDHASAIEWSRRVDAKLLEPELLTLLDLARLKSEEALGRLEVALESVTRLEAHAPEALNTDPEALRAAARAREVAGLLDASIENYVTYANVHRAEEDRPAVLLRLGQILARVGKFSEAERYLNWLIDEHPKTPEATQAKLSLIELDGGSAKTSQIDAYLELIRDAENLPGTRQAAQRLVDRLVAAGLPLELLMALAQVARETDEDGTNGVTRMAVLDAAQESLELILALLASREDHVSVAAASVQAVDLGLRIPESQIEAVRDSRRRLGLPPLDADELVEAIDRAVALSESEDWAGAVATLRAALPPMRAGEAPAPATEARALSLLATSLWKSGETDEALTVLDDGLKRLGDVRRARSLHVLRADILFATEKKGKACAAYDKAAALRSSRWVDSQIARCEEAAKSAKKKKTNENRSKS